MDWGQPPKLVARGSIPPLRAKLLTLTGGCDVKILKSDRGSVLLIAVIILSCMMVLGATMIRTAQIEILMSYNTKVATKAFYCADSAITLATGDMRSILESEGQWHTPTAGWVGSYTNEDYAVDDMDFDFEATFKTDESGNVIRWGDPDDDYIFEENTTEGAPVVRIASNGRSGPVKRQGVAAVEAEIYSRSIVIDPEAALYVGGNLENNGGSQVADGEYNMCVGGGVKDIITTPDADPNYQASDWTAGCGTFCDFEDNGNEYPIADVIHNLKKVGMEITPGNNLILGDTINNKGVYHYTGDIEVMNNLSGYGILVVDGNLTVGGNIGWNGLIIVSGNTTFNGGGTMQIYGAVITGGDVLGNGSPDILYDCDVIDDLEDNYTSYARRWWKQV